MSKIDAFDSKTWTDTEEFYFKYVDEIIQTKRKTELSNGMPWHAAYLIRAFFGHAESHIRLFSGRLSRKSRDTTEIYQARPIIDAACRFLANPESRLDIVLENEIDIDRGKLIDSHPLIRGLLDAEGTRKGVFTLSKADQKELDFLREKGFLMHFMTMDNRAVRVEVDPNPVDVKAYVKFFDKKLTKAYANLFDHAVRKDAKLMAFFGK